MATALAPESSVYILYAVYLGTHGTKNIFFVMYHVHSIVDSFLVDKSSREGVVSRVSVDTPSLNGHHGLADYY